MAAAQHPVVVRALLTGFFVTALLGVVAACSGSAPPDSLPRDVPGASSASDIPLAVPTEPSLTPGAPQPTLTPGAPEPTEEPADCRGFGITCLDAGTSRAIENRCLAPTQRTDIARLTYQPKVKLRLGADYDYTITLAPKTFKASVPGSTTADFEVTCTVQATLLGAADKLDISPSRQQRQRYLPPEPTTFSWIVTAQRTGSLAATVQLQPVMRVRSGERVEDFEGRVEPVKVTFDVTAPDSVADAGPGVVERAGGFLEGSWNLVVSLATGVAAVAGAITAVHAVRKRNRRAGASESDAAAETPPEPEPESGPEKMPAAPSSVAGEDRP